MSRYTGPRLRLIRSLDTPLPGLTRKSSEKRPHPPGQHGPGRKKKSPSGYALRLREKQKVRFNYGVSERVLRRLVENASRLRGNTGVNLVQLLERRLDNIVCRAGFARTIPAARQLVMHGHVLVNGRRVNRPSFRVTRGDAISVKESSRPLAVAALEGGAGLDSSWLTIDRHALTAQVTFYPDKGFLPFDLEVRLIVEHYSRAM